jgi:hypothetical protein
MAYNVDTIKQQTFLRDLIAAHGVALHESGAHPVGHFPFHEECTPIGSNLLPSVDSLVERLRTQIRLRRKSEGWPRAWV